MSLYSDLVSFWTLDNASTTDSYGTNTLTSGGTSAPANVAGPTSVITQASYFAGAGAIYTYMTGASNSSLATTGSMFMSCWVNLGSTSGNRTICGKFSNLNTNSTVEYLLYYSSSSSRFRFLVSSGSTLSFVDANTLGAPSTSTWYLLTGWYDSVGQTVNICANGQTTPDSASATAGLQSSTNAFFVAADNNDLYPLQGDVASIGLWIGRTPTTSDLTTLWNGGLGQTWPLPGFYRPLILRNGTESQLEDQDTIIVGSITTVTGGFAISPVAGTAASGSTPATAAGTITETGGQGGSATTTSGGTASAGGTIAIISGTGGTGAASTNGPGNGGVISITGGTGGTVTSGFSGANGGNVTIDGGAKTGSGTPGTVNIGTTNATTINIGNSGSTTAFTGTVTGISASLSGGVTNDLVRWTSSTTVGTSLITDNALSITIPAAVGTNASGSTPATAAGTITETGGQGGSATTTSGGTASAGGTLALTGGKGGTGAASTNGPRDGGAISITGGAGGTVTSGFSGANGGTVGITGGAGTGTGSGGSPFMLGGTGAFGGNVTLESGASSGSGNAGYVLLEGATGASASGSTASGNAGNVLLQPGTGGAASSTSGGTASAGGYISLIAGSGGAGAASTNGPGAGGTITMTTGNAGLQTSGFGNANGGTFEIETGAGVGTGTYGTFTVGLSSSPQSIQIGSTSNTLPTSTASTLLLYGYGALPASGSTASGSAGTITVTSGPGGAATTTSGGTASAGGNLALTGGTGGTGAASTNAPGNGGAITIAGGTGGTVTSGFSGANGGNVTIDGGAKTGSGTPGTVNIGTTNATTINIGNSGSTTAFTGTVTGISASLSGGVTNDLVRWTSSTTVGTSLITDNALSITIPAAVGTNASGSTPATAAGTITETGGQGGSATTTSGGTASAGGTLALTGGTGGTGAASTNGPGNGGAISITGGTGGTVTSGFSGANGGNVTIDGGVKTGTGTAGTVNIGTTNATTINIGNSGSTTAFTGTITGISASLSGGVTNDLVRWTSSTTVGTSLITDNALSITIPAAVGTNASGSTPATAAGTITETGGQGGSATTTSGGTASAGGTLALTGGTGGTGAASTNGPGAGGAISITGGTGGTVTSGFSGANGGNVTIDGGVKTGTGTAGTVNIGTTNATTINIGNSGSTTAFSGTLNLVNSALQFAGSAGSAGQIPVTNGTTTSWQYPTVAPGYIYQLPLSYVSSTSVQVGTGYATDSTAATTMNLGTATTISTGSTGAGGIDTTAISGTATTTSSSKSVTGSSTSFLTAFGGRTGTGTIAGASTTITGTSTKFLSQVAVGDLIGVASSSYGFARVTAIASDTSLTISHALVGDPSGNTPVIIEQSWIKFSTDGVAQVDYITSNTALTLTANITTGHSSQTVSTGALPTAQTYLIVWFGSGTSGQSVWLSTQRTSPYGVSGYNSYVRRIGSIMWTGSAIVAFDQTGNSIDREYQYEIGSATDNTRILSAGTATSWTAVIGSGCVPPTAASLYLLLIASGTAGDSMSIRRRNTGDSATTRPERVLLPTTGQFSSNVVWCACDGASAIDYAGTTTGTITQYVDVVGYKEAL